MWNNYLAPRSLDAALELLQRHRGDARVIAGGTDVVVELHRRKSAPETLIDITNIAGLDTITRDDDDRIHIGPLVTHNDVVGSGSCRRGAFPLVQACFEVGAPQIRNLGTVAGNIATASPANDTLTPLYALGADVTLESVRGRRSVPIEALVTGPGQTTIATDELIVDISIPALGDDQPGIFLKLGLRRAQAISVVNLAVVLSISDGVVTDARLALGSVAGTIVRAPEAESALMGSELGAAVISDAAAMVAADVEPISDIRGSAGYRRYMTEVMTRDALERLASGRHQETMPDDPVMLGGRSDASSAAGSNGTHRTTTHTHAGPETIDTTINGESRSIAGANDKTLSQMLRDVAGLPGTKEACCEGECGACTVILDGTAVMSCLVPAPKAHGSEIRTIEGLQSANGGLHPVQQAFVDKGASQCGFCTPGFVMSATALFDEKRSPTTEDIKQAICGNLCRCTAYYPIVAALESVAALDSVGAGGEVSP